MNNVTIKETPQEDQVNLVFKALSSSSRRQLLALLRNGEECVCHMEANTGYRQAYISQQLKVLKDAGLVIDQRDGWNIYYRAVNPQIYAVIDDIARLTGQPLETVCKSTTVCSCPKCNSENNN